MRVIVQPSTLSGVVTAPASKSAMQRACALALLNEATTLIRNPGHSNDDNAAIDMVEKLGATVAQRDDGLLIHSSGVDPFEDVVNCGESGLGIRMFTPIAALSSKPITINGEGSLLNRPMDFFDEILPQLGVAVTSNAGKLPINIQGPLQPKDISIDGSLSSQFLTGLLLGFARSAETPVTITVSDLKSKPYIDLTLKMMKEFGYTVVNENYERFVISPASKLKTNADVVIEVEGDWSGAAFLLVAGAIAGPITVKGL
ncbi:MAG TPA: hypothetical protein VKH37_05710, partial [Ferruginibacter sp.]|nr:hypothetical protein [Ferruginibacter sp.]